MADLPAVCRHCEACDILYRLYSAGLCSLEAVKSFQKSYSSHEIIQKALDCEEYWCTTLMLVAREVQTFDCDPFDQGH